MTYREPIPVLRSILSAEALGPVLADQYRFEVFRVTLIKAVVLDTYQVWSSDGRFVFRIYPSRRRTLEEIEAELDFLLFLHNEGMPVSVPVMPPSGERLLKFQAPEGDRYGTLFTFADGQPLGKEPAQARSFGTLLAGIHAVADTRPTSQGERRPLDTLFLLDRPLEGLARVMERGKDLDFLKETGDRIRPTIEAVPATSPFYGFIHGDAGSGNVHVAPDRSLTVFDFDFCGPGWRIYDIATFLSGESDEVRSAFLAGYEGVRILSGVEKAAVPFFQAAQLIWMLGTRASYLNEWGRIHFSEGFIGRVLNQINGIMVLASNG